MERKMYDRAGDQTSVRGRSPEDGGTLTTRAEAGSTEKSQVRSGLAMRPSRAAASGSRGAAVVAVLVLILTAGLAMANRQAGAQGVDAPQPEAVPEAKKRVEPRGRLPAYYSQVIDKEQRETIYAIQARIAAEIQKLQEQVAMLEQQRDKEVREVLSPDQLAKVQKMTDDAKAKRLETARKKKLATADQPAGEAPPE